ncbi:MAG: DUF1727 domain-containing protein [Acidimicrobiales bacterium]
MPARAAAAVAAVRAVNGVSRRLGLGSGTVIGGSAGLLVDRALLGHLAAGRRVALVSGTNGKTTTTGLLAAALSAADGHPVVTNDTGANMPAGHVAALAAADGGGGRAVLEVDEGYLPALVGELSPEVLVLLNLSRDQLDRTAEVRMTANRWRAAAAGTSAVVVANADDPLVAWGAGSAASVRWVAAGLGWRADAAGCPACQGRVEFEPPPSSGWSCGCGFARPAPGAWIEEHAGSAEAVLADGRRLALSPGVPGRFNRANALMAAVAAEAMGVEVARSLEAIAGVGQVAGRFSRREVDGVAARLMLAKNPAGWAELLDLVCPGTSPVVVGINARVADGRDPSWLWDVPFERLGGRPVVVAAGERCRDLSVRLRYAGVDHRVVADPRRAVVAAGRPAGHPAAAAVDVIGNYTVFFDLAGRR